MTTGDDATDPNPRGDRTLTLQEQELVRRNTRRVTCLLVFGTVILTATVVGSLALAHRQHPDRSIRAAAIIVGGGVLLLWTFIVVVGVKLRSGSASHREVILSADRAATRRVSKRLRRGEPIAPEDRRVAAALVASIRSQRFVTWIFAGAAALNLTFVIVSLTTGQPDPVNSGTVVLQAIGAVLFGAVATMSWLIRRRIVSTAARYGVGTHP